MRYKICENKCKKSDASQLYCPHDQFDIFKFIGYSKSEAVLLCPACVLFPMPAHQGSRAETLISHSCKVQKHGSEDLKGQLILHCHIDSMTLFKSLITTMKNIKLRVENRANKNSEETIKQSRKLIISVIRAVIDKALF